MASTCSFLQLRFPNQSNSFRSSSTTSYNLSNPSPASLSLSPSSIRPRSFSISATSENPNSWIENRDSTESVDSIINPSLRYANIMFFRSAYNVQIVVDENEPEEAIVRRFRREVSKAGVIPECKRRKFFENKQEEKKRKTREAAKRNRRRRFGSGPRFSTSTGGDDAAPKKGVEDEDNWDMPGDLPL